MTAEHAGHPEELLATYVEGEATDEERQRVQTLLAACSECRTEVDLAVQARAALQTVPELEAPSLRIEGVAQPAPAGAHAAASPRGVMARLREWSSERLAWGAGAVVVGSLVALFVLVQSSGGPAPQQAARAPRPAAGSDMGLLEGAPNYTPESLDALARRLVTSQRTAFSSGEAPGPATATKRTATPLSGASDRARDCLRRGGGLPAGARPVHVEEAAFRGIPAFVGAFESAGGERRYLLVLAVNRSTCDALYVINRSL